MNWLICPKAYGYQQKDIMKQLLKKLKSKLKMPCFALVSSTPYQECNMSLL